ncbi:hypothetical protein Bbelb_291740 [Branchiostoma belcheri]|nr:hypothetical protein Bbelb_291740 [Branchiostoma belcheri]
MPFAREFESKIIQITTDPQVRDLESKLHTEQRRHQETLKNLREYEHCVKELRFQACCQNILLNVFLQDAVGGEKPSLRGKIPSAAKSSLCGLTRAVLRKKNNAAVQQVCEGGPSQTSYLVGWPNGTLRTVVRHKNLYCTPMSVAKARTFVPIQTQPEEATVIKVQRNYNSLNADRFYFDGDFSKTPEHTDAPSLISTIPSLIFTMSTCLTLHQHLHVTDAVWDVLPMAIERWTLKP